MQLLIQLTAPCWIRCCCSWRVAAAELFGTSCSAASPRLLDFAALAKARVQRRLTAVSTATDKQKIQIYTLACACICGIIKKRGPPRFYDTVNEATLEWHTCITGGCTHSQRQLPNTRGNGQLARKNSLCQARRCALITVVLRFFLIKIQINMWNHPRSPYSCVRKRTAVVTHSCIFL